MSLIEYNGESKVIKRICELLDTMSGINFEVVQTLPTTDISTNTIYLVPKQSAEVDNIYDEYINTDGTSQGWELIGTTEIDLSNYYTKTEVDNLIPTDFVPKSTGGVFENTIEIVRKHTGTTSANSILRLGNDKAEGDVGTTRGVVQIYDRNGKYTNIFPSDNSSSGNVYLPKDKPNNSVLLVETDADEVETGIWNLVRQPYFHSSGSSSGTTRTVNADGSITFTGTASATYNFNIKRYTQDFILPKGTYHWSCCPSGGSATTYYSRIQIYKNGSLTTLCDDYGNGADFTLTEDSVMQINATVYNGYAISGSLVFRPNMTPIKFPACDKTNAGVYTLQATVDVNGNATYSWV